jgi:hypothetical protein
VRRWLITIAIFLLAGVVVNVGVAWASSFQRDLSFFQHFPRVQLDLLAAGDQWVHRGWFGIAEASPGYLRLVAVPVQQVPFIWRDQSTAAPLNLLYAPPFRSPPGSWTEGRTAHLWGWPLAALWDANESIRPRTTPGPRVRDLSPVSIGDHALPCRVLWPGFVVNTIFYAAILWLLIPGPFALRRLIRRRRGLCPKCAYPMGHSETCTECGRPLPKRAVV